MGSPHLLHRTLVWKALRRLRVPAVGIYGGQSYVLSAPVIEKWRSLRPDMRLFEIAAGGHLLPLECPTGTADMVTEGLARLGFQGTKTNDEAAGASPPVQASALTRETLRKLG